MIPGLSSSLVKLFAPAVAQAQGEPGLWEGGLTRAIEAIAVTGSHSSFHRSPARQPLRQPLDGIGASGDQNQFLRVGGAAVISV